MVRISNPQVGGGLQILDEGVKLAEIASSLNFVGTGVTGSVSGDDVTVTITAGSGWTFTNSPGFISFYPY